MGYTESEAKKFIEYIAPIIRAEATKRGYAICSTAIAQAIVEGAAGTSTLAKVYHNHFGMKVGTGWTGQSVKLRTKEEYKKGVLTPVYSLFRVYPNDIEGISGYYDFLSYKRYENLKNAKDYRQYAEYIKKDGWATSSSYRDNLISKVEKYQLQKYDNIEQVKPSYSVGKTYKTTANMKIRFEPDGDRVPFDQITENAKLHSFKNEDGFAVLKEGSKVTCRSVKEIDGNIWLEIPSGYIAAYYNNKIYVS